MSWRSAAAVLEQRSGLRPKVGVVLGSGLGAVADAVQKAVEIPYAELPGFPVPTVPGHGGRAVVGTVGELPVAVLQGRGHLYEGIDPDFVRTPVRALRAAGAEMLVLTNAAGSLHREMASGRLMLISDHINLTGQSPIVGANFVDLTDLYSARLRALARELDPTLAEGVYAALPGPHYETPAEIRMLRTLGADLVGMSTALEAIAARAAGMEVLGLSMVTNAAAGITGEALDHLEVLAAGKAAASRLGEFLLDLIGRLP